MFKKFNQKIEALNIYCLLLLTAFFLLALTLGIFSFVYDTLLLGIMLNGPVEIKDVVYSVVFITVTGFLARFLIKRVNQKRTSKNIWKP